MEEQATKIIDTLLSENKITSSDALVLLKAIASKRTEFVPYTLPDYRPNDYDWWRITYSTDKIC